MRPRRSRERDLVAGVGGEGEVGSGVAGGESIGRHAGTLAARHAGIATPGAWHGGIACARDQRDVLARARDRGDPDRLADTIDQLVYRANPKTIVSREVSSIKAYFVDPATGAPRTDNILKVAGGVVGVVVLFVLIRKVVR